MLLSFPDAEHSVPPSCPQPWVDHMVARPYASGAASVAPLRWQQWAAEVGSAARLTPDGLAALLADLPGADATPDSEMLAAVGYATITYRMQTDGAHETLGALTWRVLNLAAEGHPGVTYALRAVVSAFFTENDRRARRGLPGVRDQRELDAELERAISGAIRKIGAGTSGEVTA